ncbi:MAG: PIN domain-containing protein, partial [Acidimicrobiia bacterium]|nr:PIN domain-containing protein [Acidimicrobiia bacterium]
MSYAAVLDADVLHPQITVDLLLRLAERRLFRPLWSTEILDEVRRSLLGRGIPEHAVTRRVAMMEDAFPEAIVDWDTHFLSSVPPSVDPDDRHVVAAALAGRADAIVTR